MRKGGAASANRLVLSANEKKEKKKNNLLHKQGKKTKTKREVERFFFTRLAIFFFFVLSVPSSLSLSFALIPIRNGPTSVSLQAEVQRKSRAHRAAAAAAASKSERCIEKRQGIERSSRGAETSRNEWRARRSPTEKQRDRHRGSEKKESVLRR